MLTFKDYELKANINESYSPDMVREFNTNDIKVLSTVLNGDWNFNIQASKFVKIDDYVGKDGKFIYNARKSYAGNPIVVVLNKTRKTIHVARFGMYGDNGSVCYTWSVGGYINRRDNYKMTHFNNDIEYGIKSGNELLVFVCEKPVLDRAQIRAERDSLSSVENNGTIQDRLAKKKFENFKNEFYLDKRNYSLKTTVEKLNANCLDSLKKDLNGIDPTQTAFDYKVRECVRMFDKKTGEVRSYRFSMEEIEKMLKDNKYDTGWNSMEKNFSDINTKIDNLKKLGIWY